MIFSLLDTTVTDTDGFFQFSARTNWDEDDPDLNPNNRRLDLYVVWGEGSVWCWRRRL